MKTSSIMLLVCLIGGACAVKIADQPFNDQKESPDDQPFNDQKESPDDHSKFLKTFREQVTKELGHDPSQEEMESVFNKAQKDLIDAVMAESQTSLRTEGGAEAEADDEALLQTKDELLPWWALKHALSISKKNRGCCSIGSSWHGRDYDGKQIVATKGTHKGDTCDSADCFCNYQDNSNQNYKCKLGGCGGSTFQNLCYLHDLCLHQVGAVEKKGWYEKYRITNCDTYEYDTGKHWENKRGKWSCKIDPRCQWMQTGRLWQGWCQGRLTHARWRCDSLLPAIVALAP